VSPRETTGQGRRLKPDLRKSRRRRSDCVEFCSGRKVGVTGRKERMDQCPNSGVLVGMALWAPMRETKLVWVGTNAA